jgi:hypothetical protein
MKQLALSLGGSGEKLVHVRRKYPIGALATLDFSAAGASSGRAARGSRALSRRSSWPRAERRFSVAAPLARRTRLRGDAGLLERPHQLARLVAEEAASEADRVALKLVSAALDQPGELADGRLVGEAIAPLTGPLSEDREVVILPDQIRQLVSAPGDSLHLHRRGGSDDLRRVPEVLGALCRSRFRRGSGSAGTLPRGDAVDQSCSAALAGIIRARRVRMAAMISSGSIP